MRSQKQCPIVPFVRAANLPCKTVIAHTGAPDREKQAYSAYIRYKSKANHRIVITHGSGEYQAEVAARSNHYYICEERHKLRCMHLYGCKAQKTEKRKNFI